MLPIGCPLFDSVFVYLLAVHYLTLNILLIGCFLFDTENLPIGCLLFDSENVTYWLSLIWLWIFYLLAATWLWFWYVTIAVWGPFPQLTTLLWWTMSKYGQMKLIGTVWCRHRRQHHVNIELFNPIGLSWVGVELSNEKSNLFIWLGFMCIDAQTTTLSPGGAEHWHGTYLGIHRHAIFWDFISL